MQQHAIEISGLTKKYANGVEALKNVNLTIEPGAFFALLGANGAGKSTIIGIMTSLINKTSGSVKIFGHDIDHDFSAAKECIGVVPQDMNLGFFDKVQDIVVAQAGYHGIPRSVALQRSEEILKQLGLWEKRDEQSINLSGGMKRRLMVARALINEPKLLILDEPTAGVDVEQRQEMWRYIQKINESGTTILLTTHYLEEVEQLCRSAAIMHNGEIVRHDTVKNLLTLMDRDYYVVTVNSSKNHREIQGFEIKVIDDDTIEATLVDGQNISQLVSALEAAGMIVVSIRPRGNRLEGLFLDIVKKDS